MLSRLAESFASVDWVDPLIAAASRAIRGYCRRQFTSASYTEYHDGRGWRLGEAQAFVGFGPSISMASALTEQGTSQVPLNSLPSCSSTQVRMLVSDSAIAEQARRAGMNEATIAKCATPLRSRSAR